MPESVVISCPGLVAALARLEALRAALPAVMTAANEVVAEDVHSALLELYPPVAKYFQVSSAAGDGESLLASVRVWTEEPKALWWEYGTRPHEILPRNARALRFTPRGGGGPVFATRVHHPGTKPANHREALRATLEASARAAWTDALSALLSGA